MKTIKIITFILIAGLITACGGNKDKEEKPEQITQKALIGKWQPEKIEFRNIPAFIKNQIPKDLEEELLSEIQKKGYLELRNDGTFMIKDTPDSEEYVGEWSFNGEKRIEINSEEIKLASGNKDLKIGFDVEYVSKDKLEIDYASVYKVFSKMDKIPIVGGIKMIMIYKRIK